MHKLQIDESLQEILSQNPAVVVLFGGAHCNVCNVIKPQLAQVLSDQYPKALQIYIDCEELGKECAQRSVLTLPVVQIYFDGQRFSEFIRNFSIAEVKNSMQRPYSLMFE